MDFEHKLVLVCPEADVVLREGKLHVTERIHIDGEEKCEVSIKNMRKVGQLEEVMYLSCDECNGKGHKELEKTRPIKHPLHPKHLLIPTFGHVGLWRSCYCCEGYLWEYMYCCPKCDFVINLSCVKKSPVLTVGHPKRHQHTLTLFPRQDSITCNVCALDQSRYPIYMCPSCDFVVHKYCIDLPWVIRISRHHHRISFTKSFVSEDLFCDICRRKIDSDYGGYSCNREGCSYVAHSRCATRRNVWDGEELEGEPEIIEEEEVEPYERIGAGIIRHFCHENHHLKLDEDPDRVYDESKYCQACCTPIYYGNLYSCMQCHFILHETCANLPRTKYHAIHPHLLTLTVESQHRRAFSFHVCSACQRWCNGFVYECSMKDCNFKLHIQCATISEPLIHKSHIHPLFLTSEPGERRTCLICQGTGSGVYSSDTFNCIECDFVLCFRCAVLPQTVRYKHDKHILTLSYGEEETSAMKNWCEVCETKINTCERFYMCEECCVTLHIDCLLGRMLFMKPGSFVYRKTEKLDVLLNSRMCQPTCTYCHKRCQDNIVFRFQGSTICPGHSCFFTLLYTKISRLNQS